MNRRTNWILRLLVIIITALGLGTSVVTSSARHIHYRHVRISRHYRHRIYHHGHRKILRSCSRRHVKRSQRSNQLEIKRNLSEIYWQTVRDINQDRYHYKVPRLQLNHQLSRIGTVRSRQLEKYFSHNTPQHRDEIQDLLQQDHVSHEYYGENIAGSPLGTISILAVGPYTNPTDSNSQRFTYHARNGYQLANNINNASMDHDSGDQNGHRDNDLDRHFKQIGVGVSYNKHDQNYYIAIDFVG